MRRKHRSKNPKRKRRQKHISFLIQDFTWKLLHKRDYSRQELYTVLLEKDFSEAEINRWLEKLEEYNYINDQRLIEDIITKKLQKPPIGRSLLYQELLKRKLEEQLVEDKLKEYYPYQKEKEAAWQWLKKQKGHGKKDLLKRLGYLHRKGFDKEILIEIQELFSTLDSSMEK